MVWRSRRDLEIVTSGVELPTPRWASWTKEEHRVSYSLPGVGVLRPWFDKWTDGQRRRILGDLLARCSLAQQKFCAKQLQDRIPTEALDFTTRLPRVLSLYIFSFLDPRSLCRCAQVSWYWKYLSELDQLWMLKCLRFGWYINFSPTPFEQGIWKKHYIEMVKELHVTRPKEQLTGGLVRCRVPIKSSTMAKWSECPAVTPGFVLDSHAQPAVSEFRIG
ncbi:Fbxo16 [Columba livia]|nr:Fbxo16 [Columba livia]